MALNRESKLLIGALTVSILTSIYMVSLYSKSQKEVKKYEEMQYVEESKSTSYAFAQIDQLLLEGNYMEAIQESSGLLDLPEFNQKDGAQFRKEIARRLKMQSTFENDSTESIDSPRDTIEKIVFKSAEGLEDKTDSLNFALEKLKVQVDLLKRQNSSSSKGKYLTFRTLKGNSLHYVGETKNGKANGSGIAILDSGSRYEGEWKDNLRHGYGVFYWADGEHYEGEYLNDQKSGKGTYFWTNGEKYVGDWQDDMRNGRGIFYSKSGEVVAGGIWKDDKLKEKDKKK